MFVVIDIEYAFIAKKIDLLHALMECLIFILSDFIELIGA